MKSYFKVLAFCVFGLMISVQSFGATIVEPIVKKEDSNLFFEQTTVDITEFKSNNITIVQPILEGECCGTCTVSVNLLIFSFSYSWCCNKCEEPKPEEV